MPTKRRRRERFRRPDIDPLHWCLLTDSPPPDPLPADWNPFSLRTFHRDAHELWALFRDRILYDWTIGNPSTRPSCWWRFDAPRCPALGEGWYYQRDMIEGRRLLKGEGKPAWEKYNLVPSWNLGIPAHWCDGDPAALVFETQRAYLARHGLLGKGEGTSVEPEVTPMLWEF